MYKMVPNGYQSVTKTGTKMVQMIPNRYKMIPKWYKMITKWYKLYQIGTNYTKLVQMITNWYK